MPEKARVLKRKADKGLAKDDANMAEGDSSGFEDCDSDEEDEDTNTQEMQVVETKKSKSKKVPK